MTHGGLDDSLTTLLQRPNSRSLARDVHGQDQDWISNRILMFFFKTGLDQDMNFLIKFRMDQDQDIHFEILA